MTYGQPTHLNVRPLEGVLVVHLTEREDYLQI